MGLFGGGAPELQIPVSMDAGDAISEADKLKKGIDDVGDAAKGASDNGGKLGGAFDLLGKGAMVLGGAVLGLGAGLIAATKAAADEQVGMDRLYGSIANNVKGWDGNTAAVEDYVTAQTKLAFADDQVRDGLNMLVSQTHDLTAAQDLQSVAMDLARAKGIDLAQATKLVMKADDESYAALGKLGIQIDKNATKEQALQAVRDATAGQAEKYANSTAGLLERVQNAAGDAFETIGGAILPLVQGPLQSFTEWLQSDAVQQGITTLATNIGTFLSNAFTTLQNVIAAVMPYIQPFIDAVTSFIGTISSGGDIMGAFGQYFNDMGAAIANAWTVVGPALGTLLGNVVQFIVDNGPTILSTLAGWAVNFATWVWNDAIPALMEALGGLIGAVWTWIEDNGPTILDTLGAWTQAFFSWVWDDAIPALLGALGGLIQSVWTFIEDNGPTILATLGEWTTAFFNWVMNDVLPQIPTWLGNVISAVWTFIEDNGPTILETLGEWTGAFFDWVFTDLLPQVPGWLWNIASALWTFISTNGPVLLSKLGEWTGSFLNWVMTDVLPKVPGWLGNIAGALWTWITTTAGDLGSRLFNEWIPAMWNWLTGPGGVIEKAPFMLNDVWTKLTTWIGDTAKNILTAVVDIGKNIVQGIWNGVSGAWQAFVDWLSGMVKDNLPGFIKDWLGIESPSTVMSDIFQYLPLGMKDGINRTFPAFLVDVATKMTQVSSTITGGLQKILTDADMVIVQVQAGLTTVGADIVGALQSGMEGAYGGAMSSWMSFFDELWGEASRRAQEIRDIMNYGTAGNGDAYAGNGGSGNHNGGGGGNAYANGGHFSARELMMVGERGPELLVPDHSGTIIPNHALASAGVRNGGVSIQFYIDGIAHTPAQLSQTLGARVRVTEVLT